MATETQGKREPAEKQPGKAVIAESNELSDEELQEVCGGLSTGATVANSADACVSIA